MDKYRPCPSIIALFTSDSQHPPRSRHAVYLGDEHTQYFKVLYAAFLFWPSIFRLQLSGFPTKWD